MLINKDDAAAADDDDDVLVMVMMMMMLTMMMMLLLLLMMINCCTNLVIYLHDLYHLTDVAYVDSCLESLTHLSVVVQQVNICFKLQTCTGQVFAY